MRAHTGGGVSGCAICGDAGKYTVETSDLGWKDIGGGLQIGGGGSITTELCECRRALPPRDGEAIWWTTREETIAQLQFVMFDEQAVVSLRPEVPVSADNYIVHRKGDNVYYGTTVQLHVTSSELNWLFPDEARALAAALIRAADRVDELDGTRDPAPAEDGGPERSETTSSDAYSP